MNCTEAIEYIHSLEKFGINPGLERINALCSALGNPQRELKVIHVAGTNGKGSTSTMISNILQKSGYKIAKLDNKYLDKNSDYKGIHLDVVSPSGQKFELQIHSKESMAVKNKLHPIYEKSRSMPKGSPERLKLEKQMREISAGLAMPDGINDLANIG